jgi:hypothetical protein
VMYVNRVYFKKYRAISEKPGPNDIRSN